MHIPLYVCVNMYAHLTFAAKKQHISLCAAAAAAGAAQQLSVCH